MRFKVILALLFTSSITVMAQHLDQPLPVLNDRGTSVRAVEFICDDVLFVVSLNGRLLQYSPLNERGQVSYYDEFDSSELNGKLKSVGGITLTYYDQFSWDEVRGKLKSVGNTTLTYNDRFGWDELKGKLKSIGSTPLSYYDRFDWDELKGKLKSVGNTTVTYYDRFDSDELRGRIKSVKE
ncbi:MAG: hypothetical protein K0S09_2283 [Sphingobacteriaceae bacterium]|jgi:hypothetical protein|nr:hypothetical protein [Sphingobacteriaceae bacterium]